MEPFLAKKLHQKKGMSDFTTIAVLVLALIFALVVYFIIKNGLENILG